MDFPTIRRAAKERQGEAREMEGRYVVGKNLAKRHVGDGGLQRKGKESGEEEARRLNGV